MNVLPRLILITDESLTGDALLTRLAGPLSLGPEVAVQLRRKGGPTRPLLEEARALQTLCRPAGNPLFINGRLDLALLLGIHLHLPSDDVQVVDARRLLPATSWISVAVHDAEQALAAAAADLALVSPVFSPRSKPSDRRPTLGPEGFAGLAARLHCPAFALGGIDQATAAQIDAPGFAAVSSVLLAADPRAEARALITLARRV